MTSKVPLRTSYLVFLQMYFYTFMISWETTLNKAKYDLTCTLFLTIKLAYIYDMAVTPLIFLHFCNVLENYFK